MFTEIEFLVENDKQINFVFRSKAPRPHSSTGDKMPWGSKSSDLSISLSISIKIEFEKEKKMDVELTQLKHWGLESSFKKTHQSLGKFPTMPGLSFGITTVVFKCRYISLPHLWQQHSITRNRNQAKNISSLLQPSCRTWMPLHGHDGPGNAAKLPSVKVLS